MTDKAISVLFLCTGNSARSVIAEKLLSELGTPRYVGYSAGSMPTGRPNPFALEVLERHGHGVEGIRSKSWDEFAGVDAVAIDVIITVCDNAANETCPIWPGHPLTAHWGVEDPAAVLGSSEKILTAFEVTYEQMKRRIQLMLNLDFAGEPNDLREALNAIGQKADQDA